MLVQRIKVAEDQVDDKQCGGGGSSSKQWFKLQTQCALISASHQLVGSLTLKKWIYFLVKYFLNRCSQFNQFSASLRSRWICVAQKLIKPLLPTKQIRSKPFDASLRPFLKNASEKKKPTGGNTSWKSWGALVVSLIWVAECCPVAFRQKC